jgi:hypothetical protein
MLIAGVAEKVLTPKHPTFLTGYPLPLDRYHTEVHDDIKAHCFYLKNGSDRLVIITLDLCYYSKRRVQSVREKIYKLCGIPAENIMISATHTHSAPAPASIPFRLWDDRNEMYPDYLDFVDEQITEGVHEAMLNAFPASIGMGFGICGKEQNVGGNRRDKDGPADPQVWVTAIKDDSGKLRGALINYALHPTFLHAESRIITADYPCYIYEYFQKDDPDVVVGFQIGAAGDQSSRHFRSGQNFEEAKRVGYAIGAEAARVIDTLTYETDPTLAARRTMINPSIKPIPPLDQAQADQRAAVEALENSQKNNEPYPVQRTLECTLIGANKRLRIAEEGEVGMQGYQTLFPFEIMVFGIGSARIAAVPCEIFVSYALKIKKESPAERTYLASVSNGASGGYVYTPEALEEGGYEPTVSIYAPEAGEEVVGAVMQLLEELAE